MDKLDSQQMLFLDFVFNSWFDANTDWKENRLCHHIQQALFSASGTCPDFSFSLVPTGRYSIDFEF